MVYLKVELGWAWVFAIVFKTLAIQIKRQLGNLFIPSAWCRLHRVSCLRPLPARGRPRLAASAPVWWLLASAIKPLRLTRPRIKHAPKWQLL